MNEVCNKMKKIVDSVGIEFTGLISCGASLSASGYRQFNIHSLTKQHLQAVIDYMEKNEGTVEIKFLESCGNITVISLCNEREGHSDDIDFFFSGMAREKDAGEAFVKDVYDKVLVSLRHKKVIVNDSTMKIIEGGSEIENAKQTISKLRKIKEGERDAK